MLVTSFRSRIPTKFSSPKAPLLTSSVFCTQKSHTPSFIPRNVPRADISFTVPRASTGKKCHCRPENFNNTVVVPMLFLCCYAKMLNTESGLLVSAMASVCCASCSHEVNTDKWHGLCVLWAIAPFGLLSCIDPHKRALSHQFASFQAEFCFEGVHLHADFNFFQRIRRYLPCLAVLGFESEDWLFYSY